VTNLTHVIGYGEESGDDLRRVVEVVERLEEGHHSQHIALGGSESELLLQQKHRQHI